MLTLLKSFGGTWVATILFILLIASFALWGVSGASLNFATGTLASVGSRTIKAAEFQREFQLELRRVGQQFGRQLTAQQGVQFGLHTQVLQRLINQATFDDRADALGLGVSKDELANRLTSEDAFKNAAGEFDANAYLFFIRNTGLSEREFLETQVSVYKRGQISSTFIGDIAVPDVLKDALNAHRNQERTVKVLEVDVRDIEEVKEPATAELQTYFDGKLAGYRAPEYRSIKYLSLTLSDIQAGIDVPDADARKYYDDNKNAYTEVEKRAIRRITFDTEAKAKEAETKLKAGTSFDDLVKQLGLKASDISLGTLQKSAVLDKKIAELAFSLEKGKPSDAADGDFGKVIVIVDEIEGGTTKTFDEVKADIKKRLSENTANKELAQKVDAIEDARAAGSTFEEVSSKVGVKVQSAKAVAATGDLEDGSSLPSTMTGRTQLLSEVFQSDIGIENDVIEIGRDGFIWFEVTEIKKARDRKLDEVKDRVTEDWKKDETAKRLSEKADELVKTLKDGKKIDDLGRDVKTVAKVKRGVATEDLSAAAATLAFQGAKGHVVKAPGNNENKRLVIMVDSITTPKSKATEETLTQLSETVKNDILETYILAVRDREGVTLNQEAIQRAIEPQHSQNY